MGTIGDCYDNAPMESFWGTMQIEPLNRKKWRTKIGSDRHRGVDRALLQPGAAPQLASATVPPIEFEALPCHTHPGLTLTTLVRKMGSRSKMPLTPFGGPRL